MNKLKFYKEGHSWYIDLPSYQGSKEDLKMVEGADELLDYLSDGLTEVNLNVNIIPFQDSKKLEFIKLGDKNKEKGAYYRLSNGDSELKIWLCDVTRFVFNGFFPFCVYFLKV